MRRPWVCGVVVGLLAMLVGPWSGPAWSQTPTLKIGLQGVFSGELAAYGDRQKGGVLFALSKAGEIKVGGQPLKVELVYADDQGSGEKGPIAAQQLIDARVNAVIGPGFSGPTASALPLYRQAKIPAVSPFTGANNLAMLGGGWYFRVSQRNDCQGETLAEISRGLGVKRVVVVDDNEGYGTDISNEVQWLGQKGPHDAYLRIGDCATWRRAVDAGGYTYVVTTFDPYVATGIHGTP